MLTDLSLPITLSARSGDYTLRNALNSDLDALMALTADDAVATARGDSVLPEHRDDYATALAGILQDPANALLVVEDAEGAVVGTFQLTRIPGFARRGATRITVEAVRVSSALRSSGIGSAMMRWVIDVAAPALGASLVQLTSDLNRKEAHRFYERLGFQGSHLGFKYRIG